MQNILAFLERVPLTGNEAPAWCEAYSHIKNQLDAATAAPSADTPA